MYSNHDVEYLCQKMIYAYTICYCRSIFLNVTVIDTDTMYWITFIIHGSRCCECVDNLNTAGTQQIMNVS